MALLTSWLRFLAKTAGMRAPRSAFPRCRRTQQWKLMVFSKSPVRNSKKERPFRQTGKKLHMSVPDWLTAQPFAHRGLHDTSAGVIENTAAAFSAAMAAGYGMETDLQISADGEAMVYHDDALGRLTEGSGFLADLTAAEIRAVRFKASSGRILTLGELCDIVAGRVTLLLELKSRFDGDTRYCKRTELFSSGME